MEEKMVVVKFLLFLTVTVHLSSAYLNYLQFSYTGDSQGKIITAEVLLDTEQCVCYDSNNENVIPQTEWMKKIKTNDAENWNYLTDKLKNDLQHARDLVAETEPNFIRTEGVHTVELVYGCELDDKTKTMKGFWKFSYDGEDFLSLDLNAGTWTAANDKSETIKQKMEESDKANYQKEFLENECFEWLQKYMKSNGKGSRHRRSTNTSLSPGSRHRRSTNTCSSSGTYTPSLLQGCTLPGTHSLQYFYTAVTSGINFPEFTAVGQVDGKQFMYYDSKERNAVPKTDWIQTINGDDPGYWNRQTQGLQGHQEVFKVGVQTLMQRFNHTKGIHTMQRMYGCELDDDGTKRGYSQYGYDGEDFLSLDMKTGTLVAPVPQAVITKNKWERGAWNAQRKNYLENVCIEWLKKYVDYGKDTLERKVAPEVSLFQKDSSSPVVCHATGFFPRAVMISWQKNGEDLHEDVELRETVPNQNGTFQKRSVLTVSPEELHRNQYTCVVQHEGLEKEIVLQVSDRRVLSDEGSVDIMESIIIGVVVAVLLVILGFAGLLMWKKRKKSDFRLLPVSFTSVSAQDSPTSAPTPTPCLDAAAAPPH